MKTTDNLNKSSIVESDDEKSIYSKLLLRKPISGDPLLQESTEYS